MMRHECIVVAGWEGRGRNRVVRLELKNVNCMKELVVIFIKGSCWWETSVRRLSH